MGKKLYPWTQIFDREDSLSRIHETAYPRFKPDLIRRELDEISTPNETEQRFA